VTAPESGRPLDGKTVLLTGASSGLGAHFAHVLHAAGACVAIAARREDKLLDLARKLPGVVPVTADLADDDDLDRLVTTTQSELGAIDVLVNNAGMVVGGVAAQDETLVDIRATMQVNLLAPLRLCQLVFPDMKERGGGSIVNVGSIAGVVGIGRLPQASYAASKGGLHALTRELATQWGRYGIRINTLVPGMFRSELTAEVYENEKLSEWVSRNTVLPRHSDPSDYGAALLFLAGDASSFVTGQALVVDGGWTAR
jgi:NAD(P)-dependent dehydrogenase (short-subunit alcohol dehydrogenase family)